MLALTEEQLEVQGVTKGARHKIALSILRLRERPTLLAQLEKVCTVPCPFLDGHSTFYLFAWRCRVCWVKLTISIWSFNFHSFGDVMFVRLDLTNLT